MALCLFATPYANKATQFNKTTGLKFARKEELTHGHGFMNCWCNPVLAKSVFYLQGTQK